MALGIIAISLLSIMAMLAQAMDGAREAAGRTISAQIGSRLMGELQLMDWDSVESHSPEFRYFDEFGEELEVGGNAEQAIFTAYALVEDQPPTLASANSMVTQLPCRQVLILVSDVPGPRGEEIINEYRQDGRFSRRLHLHRSAVVNLEK